MKQLIFISLLFIFVIAIFTFPFLFKLNTSISGFESTDEPYGLLWFFWWLKYSHVHHLAADFAPVISSPFGMDLTLAPSYPIAYSIYKWSTIMLGEILAYNLQNIISLILSNLFMYYLVFYLTGNRLAAFLSGIIYAFCPYHIVRTWQHLSATQIEWFPLYLLALCKLKEKNSIKNIIFTVFSFVFISLFYYYYSYFAIIITATFIVFIFLSQKKYSFKIIISILLSTIASLLILLPIILPILKNVFFNKKVEDLVAGGYLRQFSDLFEFSAKPLSYFLPATSHPIFGNFTKQFIGSPLYGQSLTEHTLYLGWVPLILAFIALRRRIRHYQPLADKEKFYIGFFIFLAIVAWFFSQPPWWKIGPIKVFMPSFFMYKMLHMFRAYCRLGIVVILAVSVLAGFGLKFILERFKSNKIRIALTCLFCSLVLFEFWSWPPYKIIDVSRVPTVYYWLKDQPQDIVIAEYPLDINGANEMHKFYQTTHEKKIINGTIPSTYANKIAQTIIKLSDSYTTSILKWLGAKYVLVHRQEYLNTELIEWIEELNNIPKNKGLKFLRSFPAQACPRPDIKCTQKIGPVDVYEVIASPKEPKID